MRLRDAISGARSLLGILSGRWALAGPRSVALDICSICNTRCWMCWNQSPLLDARQSEAGDLGESSPGTGSRHMDPGLFETIVGEVRSMGGYRVVLSGRGEPTLHPEFDRMLGTVADLGMEPYVMTNGVGISEERARGWVGKRAHFRFSLHAGDAETWCRVHPGGTAGQFEEICRAIRLLAAAGAPRVSLLHVLQRDNSGQVRDMIEHARESGVGEILFRPVRADGPLGEVALDEDQERELRAGLADCLPLADRCGIRTNLKEYLDTNLHVRAGVLDTMGVYRRVPCYVGWVYAEIGLDGTITPCLDSSIVMGRAGERPLRDIWRSVEYRAFRREAITMPRRGDPVAHCRCDRCCMVKYNVNIYNLLHCRSFRADSP